MCHDYSRTSILSATRASRFHGSGSQLALRNNVPVRSANPTESVRSSEKAPTSEQCCRPLADMVQLDRIGAARLLPVMSPCRPGDCVPPSVIPKGVAVRVSRIPANVQPKGCVDRHPEACREREARTSRVQSPLECWKNLHLTRDAEFGAIRRDVEECLRRADDGLTRRG